VLGLTTGATIWAVAAVGVTVGSGHVAAGLVFTLLILGTLTVMQRLESMISGSCRPERARLTYHPQRGKTRPRLQSILDRYRLVDAAVRHGEAGPDEHWIEVRVCTGHREHREVLRELVEIEQVQALDVG